MTPEPPRWGWNRRLSATPAAGRRRPSLHGPGRGRHEPHHPEHLPRGAALHRHLDGYLRGGATQLINTNKLLRRYEGITGLKTGTTGGAGICISPAPPGTASPSSRSSWAHRPAPTASTPPRLCWTTASGPMSRAAAKTRGTATPDHGQGQRGGQRPAGLLGPAGDGAGGEGERGIPAYRADPARGAGSPGGAGPDAGQSRRLSGGSTSGRVRSACSRRCAEDDRPGCHRPAVAEPHRRGMTENCALPVKNGQQGQRMAWTFV